MLNSALRKATTLALALLVRVPHVGASITEPPALLRYKIDQLEQDAASNSTEIQKRLLVLS
jgi:hypothetical protein